MTNPAAPTIIKMTPTVSEVDAGHGFADCGAQDSTGGDEEDAYRTSHDVMPSFLPIAPR